MSRLLPRGRRARRIGIAGLAILGLWIVLRVILAPPERAMLPYGELRVGIDPSTPPLAVDTGGAYAGLEVDLARALAERLDVPLRFVPLGFDGLYDALIADQADVILAGLRPDASRLDVVRYIMGYFDAGLVLVHADGADLPTMQAMDGRTLAVEFGTDGDLEARGWQRRLHVLHVLPLDTPAAVLEAVAAGQADAALLDALSARLGLEEHAGLVIAPEVVTHDWIAPAVRADAHRLGDALDAALQAMQADGTLDALLARWL